METLYQILSPDFLLRNSIYTSVARRVSLAARRGVSRNAPAGVHGCGTASDLLDRAFAIALSLPLWLGFNLSEHSSQSAHTLAFIGSITFSLTAILVLAFWNEAGVDNPRAGSALRMSWAAAMSILLLSKNPYGEIGWLDMLKGEGHHDIQFRSWSHSSHTCSCHRSPGLFHKELLLVSFDREMAIILRKNVIFWDVLLYLLIGLTVSMAVLSVGPLIAFGFLLIPALTAHMVARNMKQFTVVAR